jgi:antitoxin (DNA-binding transcriptional repressor) of toxin-antitoxin stability system
MPIVTVQEAKTHLSRLLVAVEAGESVVIRRGKTVVARLVPASAPPKGRRFGAAAGLYGSPPDDAFAPLSGPDLEDWESGT